MKITIKTISGKVYQLEDLEANLTVEELKLLTQKHTDIEPECQRLIFKGKVLKNEQTLTDVKLSDGDCIIVVKSRKKKKRTTEEAEEKKDARNAPEPSANANNPPPQANAQANVNQPGLGFMGAMDFNALLNGFQQNAANNPNANQAAANPFAPLMGMGMGANNQMPDLNAMMQMMQNPVVQEMMRSPAMQQMLQEVMRNPQLLNNMIQRNQMLGQMMPGMMNNPLFRGAAAAGPQAAAAAAPPAAANNQAAPAAQQVDANNPAVVNAEAARNNDNANAQPAQVNQPAAAAVNPLAFLFGQMNQGQPNAQLNNDNVNAQPAQVNQPAAANPANPLALLLGQMNQRQPNAQANAQNPFLALLNAQQMRQQPLAPQVLNDAQARELYTEQLGQLRNMGFLDEARNLRALRETAGSVESAINMLLQ